MDATAKTTEAIDLKRKMCAGTCTAMIPILFDGLQTSDNGLNWT